MQPVETARGSDVLQPFDSACPNSLGKASLDRQAERGERAGGVSRESQRPWIAVRNQSEGRESPPHSLESSFDSGDQVSSAHSGFWHGCSMQIDGVFQLFGDPHATTAESGLLPVSHSQTNAVLFT